MPKKAVKKPRPKPARVDPIPSGFRTVTPYLAVASGSVALDFYKKAFGAKELVRTLSPDGKLVHGRVRMGDSIVMLSDVFPGSRVSAPSQLGTSTVTIHSYARDVDAFWERAVRAGATPTMPLDDQFWGERYGQLEDPFGHHWSVSMPISMTPAQMKHKRDAAMASFAAAGSP